MNIGVVELLEYLVTAAVVDRAVELRGIKWNARAQAQGTTDLQLVDREPWEDLIPQAAAEFRGWRALVMREFS
jgi:hypothetical protein